jgi:hypothetical protein
MQYDKLATLLRIQHDNVLQEHDLFSKFAQVTLLELFHASLYLTLYLCTDRKLH